MSNDDLNSRRDFLKQSGLATAGVVAASNLSLPMVHASANDTIKVGVIGCGGRGKGAAVNCMEAGGNVKIVAVGDAFPDKAKKAAEELAKQAQKEEFKGKVDIGTRVFSGLDAYQQVINAGVDLVIIAGPPGFRPQHYAAAVAAGKNVFMEKPVCVCPGGYRKVVEANKLADQKNLKVMVGLQRHHDAKYVNSIQEIAEGKLGDVTLLRVYWNGSGIWNRAREAGMTEMQFQAHNWYHFTWLSGDNICEQHIHNLDIGNWIMSEVLKKQGADWAHPVEANGMGASTTRGYNGKDKQGQIFDAHFVEYTYENGLKMFSQCRHQQGTFSLVDEFFHSTKEPKGRKVSASAGSLKLQHGTPFVQEHYALQQAIANNRKLNAGWYGAVSSMTAVMGYIATYSGKVVKWDDLVQNGVDTFPSGPIAWNTPPPVMPDANGFYPIAVPGKYEIYPGATGGGAKKGKKA